MKDDKCFLKKKAFFTWREEDLNKDEEVHQSAGQQECVGQRVCLKRSQLSVTGWKVFEETLGDLSWVFMWSLRPFKRMAFE
jgi:hypothetical protein